ncbi:hypothetical protein BGZ95_008921 [Linnemannia exigua]|uniref:F-box domain-containing protein n=1 Tax=Linnemannia exigua TaxID=604196 RepID=A0AAD4DDP4_9FUNG|nr:hypothetical protein BGZ95_008921 [Linnemannia exigua]
MGILSSILRVLPGFVTPKPNTPTTFTPLLQVTPTATTLTDATTVTSTASHAASASINTGASSSSAASSSLYSPLSHSLQEMIDHDMGTVSAATPLDESSFVHKTPHSHLTTAKTMNVELQLQQQQQQVGTSSGLPSNKRQESDLTTPDIDSTVLSMDLNKDPFPLITARGPTTNDVQGHVNGFKTTITTENVVMVVYNNDKDKTSSSLTESGGAEVEEEETYPLVQNRMFDVPEIIRSIAEFLDKPSLARCCRVSKFWTTHCTPLLWRHIVDKHWRFGQFCASIQSQSHYIRSIKCEVWTDYEEMLLCQFPRLKGIAFNGCKESMTIREKILAKVTKTLTSLVLSSVAADLSIESAKAIQSLHQLTTLKIINMTVSHQLLADILRQCENLDFLSLSRVQLDDTPTAHGAGNGGSTITGSNRALELVPTRIKYLAMKEVTASPEYLTGMIRSCPNLLELSFVRNESLVITTEMIRAMQETCPRLYAIDVGSCKLLEQETFTPLFTTLTQMTILNLSGTKVGDEDLSILAQKCRGLVRLDIQYCPHISSKGLHRYLSHCSSALKHLEASGVTIEPESFDDRAWTCTNLEIMFVHIGLIGSYEPYVPSTTKARVGETVETKEQDDVDNKKPTLPIEPPIKVETPVSLLTRIFTGATSASTSTSTSISASTSATTNTLTTSDHHSQRHRKTAGTSTDSNIHTTNAGSNSFASIKTSKGTGAGTTATGMLSGLRQGHGLGQEDVEMKHVLHPIQDVSQVQYLGLMGCGPKLNRNTPCHLLSGFRSIKRLHLLGLYQSFKKEDLEWLVESLPELCRIDAEKYNVSDEILTWFHGTFSHVRIHRQE